MVNIPTFVEVACQNMADQQDSAGAVEGGSGQTTNINVVQQESGPGFVARATWFIFVGWWATGLWITIAWLLNLTIIGIPLGFKMINSVPKVLTLKSRQLETEVITDEGGNTTIAQSNQDQVNLFVRAVYFLLVGWWASGLWMFVAYLLSLTIVGIPFAVWMYNQLPAVTSLYRY